VVDQASDGDLEAMLSGHEVRQREQFRKLRFCKAEFFFIDHENSKKYRQLGTPIVEPVQVFWSLTSEIMVAVYNRLFVVFALREDAFRYDRSFSLSVSDGCFWENLFFFVNESAVYLLVNDLAEGPILIELAAQEARVSEKGAVNLAELFGGTTEGNPELFDNIHPEVQRRPPGQLKILLIVDLKLVLVDQSGSLSSINLDFPFVRFCMLLQHGRLDDCFEIAAKFDRRLCHLFVLLFLAKGAKGHAQQLGALGLSLLDQTILELEHGFFVRQQLDEPFLRMLLASGSFSQEVVLPRLTN